MRRGVILYVAPMFYGSSSLQRFDALRDIGFVVIPIDYSSFFPSDRRGWHGVWRRLGAGPSVWRLNSEILAAAGKIKPDIVWFDKSLMVTSATLRRLKSVKSDAVLLHYSPDDMMNPENQSRHFRDGLPFYDLFMTTKSYNVPELKQMGARAVRFIENAFDPRLHRPVTVTDDERKRWGARVGFIGTHERERAEAIATLAEDGVGVRIWGDGWRPEGRLRQAGIAIEGRPVWGDEYPLAVSATDINLCFLRKVNRDLQTTRSVEIPACGGFMLAERSAEHLGLFREDEEAVFFSTGIELREKVRYFITHDEERKRIAERGRQRCLNAGYSNQERIRRMFMTEESLRPFVSGVS